MMSYILIGFLCCLALSALFRIYYFIFVDTPFGISKIKGWDEKCLEFYKRNDLFSNTASNNQIRASIQKYDQKKYDVYRKILNDYQKKYNWINQEYSEV